MDDTMVYLNDVLDKIGALDTKEAVHKHLDELEFLYDAVDPMTQELIDQVIFRLNEHLQTLT